MIRLMNRINLILISISILCFIVAIICIGHDRLTSSIFLFTSSYVILAIQSLNMIYACTVLHFGLRTVDKKNEDIANHYKQLSELVKSKELIELEINKFKEEMKDCCKKIDNGEIDDKQFDKTINEDSIKIETLEWVLKKEKEK